MSRTRASLKRVAKLTLRRYDLIIQGKPEAVLNYWARLANLFKIMELLVEVPGEWELDAENSFNSKGEFHPCFKINDEAKHWAQIAASCLERAEEEVFRQVYKGDDFCFTGLTDTQIAPYWSH